MNTFSIEINKMNWLFLEDIHSDLCAHGNVKVKIGDEVIAGINDEEEWTISAMALFLLRTLERNHTKENPVGEQLIPCCGHFLVFEEDMDEIYVGGCPSGINFDVIHENNTVKLKTESEIETIIDFNLYKNEILKFVDRVEDFYIESGEKKLPEDISDRKGYIEFWNEWKTRRNRWK